MGNQEAVVLDLEKLSLSFIAGPFVQSFPFRCCETHLQKVIFAYILRIQGSGIINTAGPTIFWAPN